MGGNSATAAIGTMTGIPGAARASMLVPGALDALAAELQATKTSSQVAYEPTRVLGNGRLEQKTGGARSSLVPADTQENKVVDELVRGAPAPRIWERIRAKPKSRPNPVASVYHPTLRDRLGYLIYDAATGAGLGLEANRKREDAQIFADFTPAGTVFDAQDIYRAVDAGNYGDAALQAGLATLGAAVPFFGRLASKAARKLDSRVHLHDPLAAPQRPFEADYPTVPLYDKKTGRLLEDIEGRPLHAEQIAGRTFKDRPDAALSAEEVRNGGEGLGDVRYRQVGPRSIGGNAGQVRIYYDSKTGDLYRAYVKVDKTLDAGDFGRSQTHETAHVIDHVAGTIPVGGIEDELRLIYSALRTGKWSSMPMVGPEDFGYPAEDVSKELIAEAMRGYMQDPNWLKAVAPNAAKRIRAYVNPNPKINRYIQFNSLIPAAGGGIGAAAVLSENEEGREPKL